MKKENEDEVVVENDKHERGVREKSVCVYVCMCVCVQGILTEGDSTIDLLIKLACFVKRLITFSIKRELIVLVGTRRSTVLSVSLQKDFPVVCGTERKRKVEQEDHMFV